MPFAAMAAGWIVMAIALIGAGYALAAGEAVARFFRRKMRDTFEFQPVTVLKPLHSAEPALRETLESFFTQEYAAPMQIVLGVQASDDTAIPIVRELIARYPHVDAVLVTSGRQDGANPKIANLTGMMPQAKHGVLVLSDSDILVEPDYLRRIARTLLHPGVGAVTCCYAGRARANLWSRLVAQGIDYHFLPGVIAGIALGLARPCLGSTIAVKRSVLEEIGGFEAFKDRLADDYEIGFAIRELGYDVAVPPFAVTHSCSEATMAEFFRHELRWARTIRSVDPAGFAGSGITHALPLGVIAATLLGFSPLALMALLPILTARVILMIRIDRALSRPASGYWLFPLRDMLSFAVFVAAFFASRVDWRGSRFRVRADGELARE